MNGLNGQNAQMNVSEKDSEHVRQVITARKEPARNEIVQSNASLLVFIVGKKKQIPFLQALKPVRWKQLQGNP